MKTKQILIGVAVLVGGFAIYKIFFNKDEEKSNIKGKSNTPIFADDLCVAKYMKAGFSHADAVTVCKDVKAINNPKVTSTTLSTSRKFY